MAGVTALTVYQETLDILSRALMEGDWEVAQARIKLPHLQRTQSIEIVVETAEDLIIGLTAFRDALLGRGATHLVRLATDAEFMSENYLSGHHVTHTLNNAVPVVESYANRMVLLREDGLWKVLEVECMLDNPHWPIHIPHVHREGARPDALKSPENDARRQSVDPLTIYQSFIDEMSEANTEDDFEAYCNCLLFPYSSHTESLDTIISTPDEVRPFFDMLRQEMRDRGADRLERRAERAEFISSDLICGYHATDFYAGEVSVFGPIKSRMVLKRQGTTWHLKSVTNSLSNNRFPYNVPKPGKALVTLRTIQERTRT
ncbi:hypothetical protein [Roseobacter sinensis]|uniref:SnoaL-like domain-containing protein n=1 Tax=Roseobacter sinensis TaxID=2931391 RepID=A0ABT3BAD4_9RHOB|nr:hypothetical protein [Roseobacter sp. WL0113]MCV3270538.1 hypothetical protein [Roseobacter sp. WL0113]